MKKLLLSSAIAGLVSLGLGQAQARDFADIYTECGLGAMIAPNNAAVAAVTNVTWDLGTTAISSNVSSPDTCRGGQAKTAAFIFKSYEQLEADIAKGQGSYLAQLVELTGADDEAQFIAQLRKAFADLASGNDYAEMNRFDKAQALYEMVQKASA
ncbi:MAG: DUF3015 domain-containing protein [Gammaproteobacteria bacterium]|nr:MAG: DUF3015 domain-containing protein [Gammaproteobacteria bacterium]